MPTAALCQARTVTRTDLPFLDGARLAKHVAAVNTAYSRAKSNYEQACVAMGDLVTEQIARAAAAAFPGAARVLAGPVRQNTAGGQVEHLVPSTVLDSCGDVLGYVEPMSPLMYLFERLTPHLGLAHCELDLVARTWSFPYGRPHIA